jgi:hypothetical protein
MVSLPPPLPPSASELDVVLGMTVQRVVFHYGIELEAHQDRPENEVGGIQAGHGSGLG